MDDKRKYICKLGGNVPTGGLPCLLCGNYKQRALTDKGYCKYLIKED